MGNREAFYKLVSRLIPRQPVVNVDRPQTQLNISMSDLMAEAEKRINGKTRQEEKEEKKARLERLREGVKKHDSEKEEWNWETDKIDFPTL